MNFDKRKAKSIIYIGEGGRLPRQVAEVGDEATLYHNGNLVMAKITSTQGNQIVGMITRSAYHPDPHPDHTIGKEIRFLEENIFEISKLTRK